MEAVPDADSSEFKVLGKMKFQLFTNFLEHVGLQKPKEKVKYMQQYFDKIFFPTRAEREDSFLLLRLFLPQIDRERGTYGLKEANLGKIIGESLGLSKNDLNRLYHFRNPQYHPPNEASVGDFVMVMKSVVGKFCKPRSELTLGQVDSFLDRLASSEEKKKSLEFTQIIRVATIKDLEWICRIILKDLKLGLGQEKVLPIYSAAALELFNRTYNLRKVCQECVEKKEPAPASLTVYFVH